jgi:hypothetical protein
MISILSPEVRIDEITVIAGRPDQTIEVSRSGKTKNGEARSEARFTRQPSIRVNTVLPESRSVSISMGL